MKRKLLILSVFFSIVSFAQEGPEIGSAIIEIDKNNDIAEGYRFLQNAKAAIDSKGTSEVKTKNLQKYYHYQGLANLRIAQSEDEALRALNPNALEDAIKYLSESIAYETRIDKDRFMDRSNVYLQECANLLFNKGAKLSESGDKAAAAEAFFEVVRIKNEVLMNKYMDTTSYYNAVLLSEQAIPDNEEYLQKAIEGNLKLIEMGYTGISWTVLDSASGARVQAGNKAAAMRALEQGYKDPQPSPSVTPELYKALVRLYKQAGDTTAYRGVLADARQKYPNDDFFVKYELQDFLDAGEYEKAMNNLNLAIEADPENVLFPYVKGVIQHTEMNDKEGAMKSYDLALSIEPNYFDALYMKGLLFIDKANSFTEEMNKLPLNATKKYEALKAEQKQEFEKALPLFEQAYEINSVDADVIRALKEVYYKLEMPEKSMEMNEKLQSLPAAE